MRSRLAGIALLAALGGCSAAGYYGQAVRGQLEVMSRAQPIAEAIAAPETPAAVRLKLQRVVAIRDFASESLGLPANGSYRRYADLGRPYVVWNVFAAPELSVEPLKSCFPVVGCVSYRGYYSHADAQAYANELARRGDDVYIGGVPAYSTLGWFDDPVLSTFINYPDGELARLIFHELAHQVLYVKDDTMFNESFAVTVERAGVKRWLAAYATPAERRRYDEYRERQRAFLALVRRYHDCLAAAYAAPVGDAVKRAAKRRLFDEMRVDYAALKASWGGYAGYDRWFEHGVNNANLASVAVYTELVPGFEALLAREDGDLPRFYAAVKALAREPKAERDAALAAMGRTATASAAAIPRSGDR